MGRWGMGRWKNEKAGKWEGGKWECGKIGMCKMGRWKKGRWKKGRWGKKKLESRKWGFSNKQLKTNNRTAWCRRKDAKGWKFRRGKPRENENGACRNKRENTNEILPVLTGIFAWTKLRQPSRHDITYSMHFVCPEILGEMKTHRKCVAQPREQEAS